MSSGKPRDVQKERFWRKMIRRWRTSGQSVRAYCQQYGLIEANFHAWRRTLATRDAAALPFAAVGVLPEAVLGVPAVAVSGAVELVLANRRVLRIDPGFDEATLRRLLPLLEEDPRC
jgi:transposase-like protein